MKQKPHIQSTQRQPKWFALLLVVVLLYTALPLQWAHSYAHTDDTCAQSNACHDETPCHISLYHQHLPEQTCQHSGHYDKQHEGCEFCYLLSHHQQQQYTQPLPYFIGHLAASSLPAIDFSKNYRPVFAPSQTNKGPPVA